MYIYLYIKRNIVVLESIVEQNVISYEVVRCKYTITGQSFGAGSWVSACFGFNEGGGLRSRFLICSRSENLAATSSYSTCPVISRGRQLGYIRI